VADWLKEQIEETGLAIVVLGLQRCLEVLKQNEQLRRRFAATLRVGAFRWESKDDRTTYRAFLRAVQEQLPEYMMPPLADLEMAFRMHHGCCGLIGYTMKIIRGAARIAGLIPGARSRCEPWRNRFGSMYIQRLDNPNPFLENFDADIAPPLKLRSETASPAPMNAWRSSAGRELHA
jgi:hypothetical protein